VDFATAQALLHRQEIIRTQESMKQRIARLPGAQVLGTTDTLMNAVLVRVPAAQYRSIRQFAGVKKVYFSRPKRMLLDHAAAINNAQSLWTMAGGQSKAGQGIKIGFDSGIDITNNVYRHRMSAPQVTHWENLHLQTQKSSLLATISDICTIRDNESRQPRMR
jgi:hypothetical protein